MRQDAAASPGAVLQFFLKIFRHSGGMRTILLAALGLLAACETQQAYCERSAGRDLAELEALIARTEVAIARGYTEEEVALPYTYDAVCEDAEAGPNGRRPRCTLTGVRYETRRTPIDPAVWQPRLDNLRAMLPDARRAAMEQRAACAARFPEA
jgi:hypothetical protein